MSDGVLSWISSNANILNNVAASLIPVERLITGAAYLLGLMFAFKAIHTLKAYGESRSMMSSHSSFKEPLIYFLVSAVFLYFPTALSVMLNTTFGSSNILEYAPINSSNDVLSGIFGPGSLIGRPLSIIIQVIGLIAFVRGWILISRGATQGQPAGSTGKGMVHVIGGILAMNLVATLEIINNTLFG